MNRVIKDGDIRDDNWQLLGDDAEAGSIPDAGDIIVSLACWQENRDTLLDRSGRTGVCLQPGEEPEAIAADLGKLPLVAIHFPAFKDGRGYSYARELRTRYSYQGEIRAVGDVLRDQLFYMKRVGFNAFAVREDRDIEEALGGLNDFSVTYQGDVTDPRPIYRRA